MTKYATIGDKSLSAVIHTIDIKIHYLSRASSQERIEILVWFLTCDKNPQSHLHDTQPCGGHLTRPRRVHRRADRGLRGHARGPPPRHCEDADAAASQQRPDLGQPDYPLARAFASPDTPTAACSVPRLDAQSAGQRLELGLVLLLQDPCRARHPRPQGIVAWRTKQR